MAPGTARAEKEVYKMKLGSVIPATSAWGKVAKRYKKETEEFSDGMLEIELFLGGQLGSEEKMLEMMQEGEIQAVACTAGSVARFVPELSILEMPYLFHDVDEARMLTDKVIAPLLVRKLSEKKMFGTAMFDNGFRNFIAKRFIKKPSDLKWFKVASDDTDMHMAFWKSLGASAIPVHMDKLSGVLKKGEANLADNSILGIFSLGLFAKTKYITESEHIYQAAMIVLNNDWWESLPVELKLRLLKKNMSIVVEMREATVKELANVRRGMEATGVKFYKLTDKEKEPFVKLSEPVIKQFEGMVGRKLLQKVLESRAVYRKMKAEGKSDEEIAEKIKVKI